MDADVPWPWWVGLLIVCAVLLAIAFAVSWAAERQDDDR